MRYLNYEMTKSKCPHLDCLVYHPNGVCNCQMEKYCPKCKEITRHEQKMEWLEKVTEVSDRITQALSKVPIPEQKVELEDFDTIFENHFSDREHKRLKSFISSLLAEKDKEIEAAREERIKTSNSGRRMYEIGKKEGREQAIKDCIDLFPCKEICDVWTSEKCCSCGAERIRNMIISLLSTNK